MTEDKMFSTVEPEERTANASVALTPTLIEFLDEVGKARKLSRSAALRAILGEFKTAWDEMTPAQKRGAYEA